MRRVVVAAVLAGGVLQWAAVVGVLGTAYAWTGRSAAESACAASGPDGRDEPGQPDWGWAPPRWTCTADSR